jgi:hypothetical protein
MSQDELDRHEEAAREVIAALGRLSHGVQAPPDFLARVLTQAERRPASRPGRRAWLKRWPTGRLALGLEVAAAAVFVLAVVGAVPQYLAWFNTYVRGVPSEREAPFGALRTRGLEPPREAAGAALPLGPWQLNANGKLGQLTLTVVTTQGQLRGTIDGEAVWGVWDEAAQQITFTRLRNPADPSTVQLFTGYLLKHAGGPQGVGTVTYTLAGSFTAVAEPGATAHRTAYGWYAQKAVVE